MDRTTLTLAVDSTQVGTAAAAFDRMVNAGNAAATSAGKVTSTALAQGRAIGQNLVPAINRGIDASRTLADTQKALGQDASRQVSMRYAPVRPPVGAVNAPAAAPSSGPSATSASKGTAAGRITPITLPGGGAGLVLEPAKAAAAQGAIDRLTTSARSNRTAFLQLSPAAEATARSLRQLNATPIKMAPPQGLSQAAAAFAQAQRINPNPIRQAAAAFAAVAEQAARAGANVTQANRAIGAAPRGGMTMAGAVPRAPLSVGQIVSSATGQRAPTSSSFSTSEMTIEAGRAQGAIERLTNAARDQRSTLAQLAPAAAATAGAYRNLAGAPGQSGFLTGLRGTFSPERSGPNRSGQGAGRSEPSGGRASGRPAASDSSGSGGNQFRPDQLQQLTFQLNDFAVQVASGGSALTALIQQGSQLSGTFGGVRPAFQAVLNLLTPMRLAAGGAAIAISTLAKAYHDGSRQSKAFADAIVLTGNYAGQTEGQVNALAKAVAAGGQVTIGAAREAAQAVAATGRIGPEVFNKVVEATALLSEATGKTASEVVENFVKMSDSPSKFAEEMNKSMHAWTSAERDAIKAAEEAGRATEAQIAVLDKLLPRLQKLDSNVGTIERTLRNAKNAFASFWDAALDVGREETVDEKIAMIDRKIKAARSAIPWEEHGHTRLSANAVLQLEADRKGLVAKRDAERKGAADEAKGRADQQELDGAKDVIEGWTRLSRGAEAYRKELDKVNKAIETAAAKGQPFSAEEQKIARDEVKRSFAPKKGLKDNSASQILAAQLQTDVRRIEDLFEQQRDAYEFQNAFVEAAYRNGNLSIGTLMEQRRQVIEGSAKAEIEALEKEAARLQQQLKQTKDPAERIQIKGQIEELGVRRDQVEMGAQRDIVMLNEETKASFRALGEQVVEYRAQLLQLAGDEAGAAALRAQTAIANAKLLQAQSGGQITDEQVNALARRTEAMNQYNEVQRQMSLLASNSARAEEAFALAAEQSGKSLLETERGIFALRAEELNQLGALTEKMKELAALSDNPAFKALAADLALSYAKAANAVDPALNKLRDANRQLAAGLANTAGQAPNAFIAAYGQRRLDSGDEAKSEKESYDRRINLLEGYLAETRDAKDKARLRERIAKLQAEKEDVKGESRGSSALKAINEAVVQPMAQQVFETVNKLLITDPLETYLKGQLTQLTEGNGALAGLFKDALGIKADPKLLAEQQQTAAITATSSALQVLTGAARDAANALRDRSPASAALAAAGQAPAEGQQGLFGAYQPPPVDAELAGVQGEAAGAASQLGQNALTAAADLVQMSNAALNGSTAMAQLPGIVGLFQAAVAMMSSSSGASGGGGLIGSILSLFAGGGGGGGVAAAYEAAVAMTGIFHQGGIVGQPSETRAVPMDTFANAVRYHTGGIAGQKPNGASSAFAKAAALKVGEVPAILMKNEEVLRADDPRHRDNLGMSIVARIISEANAPAAAGKDGEAGKPGQSAASTVLQSIASSKSGSSASTLAGLLDRLGVKDGEGGAAASALTVRGARELGGPVSSNSMYRVNEKGPELLQVAGKQYLMTGAQGGKVLPNEGGGKEARPVVVTNHFAISGPTNHASQQQIAGMAAKGVQRGMRNT